MNSNSDMPKLQPGESKRRRDGEKGSRRWLFLVVDVVLILAILFTVLFVVSVLTPFTLFRGEKAEERTVTYTVELAGVSNKTLHALHVGDRVTDKETGAVIGEVSAVDIRAFEKFGDKFEYDAVLDSNVVTRIEYPEELNTVTVTITVNAEYTRGRGYEVNGCRIAVGRTYQLRFPEYAGSGVCVSFVN